MKTVLLNGILIDYDAETFEIISGDINEAISKSSDNVDYAYYFDNSTVEGIDCIMKGESGDFVGNYESEKGLIEEFQKKRLRRGG